MSFNYKGVIKVLKNINYYCIITITGMVTNMPKTWVYLK